VRSSERPYLSYLLRLWKDGTGEAWTWRASIEDAHSGGRQGFATLGLLFAFLESETAGTDAAAAGDTSEEGAARPRDS
jgi:hypothetical protein